MSRARTASEVDRSLAGKCSCLECGTVVHAHAVPCERGVYTLYDLCEDDADELAAIPGVGLRWLLAQGFGFTGHYVDHSRYCPPTRVKLIEVEIQGDWDAPAQGGVGASAPHDATVG